ncbi:MAG: hypothetical protein J3Q66DRAFT_382481 [Benniella sp.]|nr:MAG: hypothetical protein J3Q66DRAFT_382481 [Benniella sp.]
MGIESAKAPPQDLGTKLAQHYEEDPNRITDQPSQPTMGHRAERVPGSRSVRMDNPSKGMRERTQQRGVKHRPGDIHVKNGDESSETKALEGDGNDGEAVDGPAQSKIGREDGMDGNNEGNADGDGQEQPNQKEEGDDGMEERKTRTNKERKEEPEEEEEEEEDEDEDDEDEDEDEEVPLKGRLRYAKTKPARYNEHPSYIDMIRTKNAKRRDGSTCTYLKDFIHKTYNVDLLTSSPTSRALSSDGGTTCLQFEERERYLIFSRFFLPRTFNSVQRTILNWRLFPKAGPPRTTLTTAGPSRRTSTSKKPAATTTRGRSKEAATPRKPTTRSSGKAVATSATVTTRTRSASAGPKSRLTKSKSTTAKATPTKSIESKGKGKATPAKAASGSTFKKSTAKSTSAMSTLKVTPAETATKATLKKTAKVTFFHDPHKGSPCKNDYEGEGRSFENGYKGSPYKVGFEDHSVKIDSSQGHSYEGGCKVYPWKHSCQGFWKDNCQGHSGEGCSCEIYSREGVTKEGPSSDDYCPEGQAQG